MAVIHERLSQAFENHFLQHPATTANRALPPVARKNGKTKSETYAFSVNFGRTDLLIGQSKAKNCEESAGDVRIGVAPQKPSKNMEKRAKFCDKKIFDVEKRNVGNRPKRIFAKFRGDRR